MLAYLEHAVMNVKVDNRKRTDLRIHDIREGLRLVFISSTRRVRESIAALGDLSELNVSPLAQAG